MLKTQRSSIYFFQTPRATTPDCGAFEAGLLSIPSRAQNARLGQSWRVLPAVKPGHDKLRDTDVAQFDKENVLRLARPARGCVQSVQQQRCSFSLLSTGSVAVGPIDNRPEIDILERFVAAYLDHKRLNADRDRAALRATDFLSEIIRFAVDVRPTVTHDFPGRPPIGIVKQFLDHLSARKRIGLFERHQQTAITPIGFGAAFRPPIIKRRAGDPAQLASVLVPVSTGNEATKFFLDLVIEFTRLMRLPRPGL
jgi:hypothetical protein